VLYEGFVASVSNDVRRFAPAIAQPTLLIAAEKDDITPIEAERHLRGMFPDAELVEIPPSATSSTTRPAAGGGGHQALSRAFRRQYAMTFMRLPQFPVSQ
jgi:pimeloyl-ACP methyl ester carboxylesterase